MIIMCGIVGYIGERNVSEVLLSGLESLEYRGYDSAGLAAIDLDANLQLFKTSGRIKDLIEILPRGLEGHVGIGHTRWATHGRPTTVNAHPHTSNDVIVVHNGIIENYQLLKRELTSTGYNFISETDTEVLAHLVDHHLKKTDALEDAVRNALKQVEGTYAVAILLKSRPDRIVVAKKDNPLVIGFGSGENFIASDVPALLKYTRDVAFLGDMELAIVTADAVEVYDKDGAPVTVEHVPIEWDISQAQKAGYPHFMIKEIHEEPRAVRECISGRISELDGTVDLGLELLDREIRYIENIRFVGCGTSYYACMLGKYIIEALAKVPVEVDISSEFRYSEILLPRNSLIISVTQSGETQDTLAAVKELKKYDLTTLGITNVMGSGISREVDQTIYTNAGPEIGVCATKTFVTQLVVILLLAIYLGRARKVLSLEKAQGYLRNIRRLPSLIPSVLDLEDEILECAEILKGNESCFYIGRHLNYPVALEGALKLKEVSYIHAEGYPGGELKHGPLALITDGVPVIAVIPMGKTYQKTLSNVKEVKARGGWVLGIVTEGDTQASEVVDRALYIPKTDEYASTILTSTLLQLLAYHTARLRGCDIDKPRNLAKSVTVE